MTIAIIAVLSALLFPTFKSARSAAGQAVCASNFRQVQIASSLYVVDYEDRFMPVQTNPQRDGNPDLDRTWVQLVLPYVKSLSVFRCPGDGDKTEFPVSDFDRDLSLRDPYTAFYEASKHAHVGYNYLNLSPIEASVDGWAVTTRSLATIEEPQRMLFGVDSVWDRTPSGAPFGGGRYAVIPPCRYVQSGGLKFDTFPLMVAGTSVLADNGGWEFAPNSPLRWGGAWAWHGDRATVAFANGSVKSLTLRELGAGCDVRPNWYGRIKDSSAYLWDGQ